LLPDSISAPLVVHCRSSSGDDLKLIVFVGFVVVVVPILVVVAIVVNIIDADVVDQPSSVCVYAQLCIITYTRRNLKLRMHTHHSVNTRSENPRVNNSTGGDK
jgi:hypothetical protein